MKQKSKEGRSKGERERRFGPISKVAFQLGGCEPAAVGESAVLPLLLSLPRYRRKAKHVLSKSTRCTDSLSSRAEPLSVEKKETPVTDADVVITIDDASIEKTVCPLLLISRSAKFGCLER
jgi:hypothetical protein